MAWTWTIPTARFKTIASWLVFVRVVQALGTLSSAALNGKLLVFIHSQEREDPKTLVPLELMVSCLALDSIPLLTITDLVDRLAWH